MKIRGNSREQHSNSGRAKDVVVIAASASAIESDQQKSLDAYCNDFISKPVRSKELLERLKLHLGLEWIYEEETTATGAIPDLKQTAAAAAIVAPPAKEVAALFELAMIGDIRGILERTAFLEQLNDKFVPFATQVRQLAKGFQVKKIREFIKKYMAINE